VRGHLLANDAINLCCRRKIFFADLVREGGGGEKADN
jgi:hypothetical protein